MLCGVMPGRWRSWRRSNHRSPPELLEAPQGPGIHVYLFWSPDGERYLSHVTSDKVNAEQLCVLSAEAVGVTPVFHVLFALYEPVSRCWYSPNHVFDPEEHSRLVLHYRMRFYFRNWHGLNDSEPLVTRFAVGGDAPLLEITSVEYSFAQAKYDFVNEMMEMKKVEGEEERSRFHNECLGMAVLHLMHLALRTGRTLRSVAKKTSFETCIPKSFAKHISEDKLLTKIRIRRMFGRFVVAYQRNMHGRQLDGKEIMCKYLCTLEYLAPRFGSETFSASLRRLQQDEDADADNDNHVAACEIMVSATRGIQWRTHQQKMSDQWKHFCDFPDIVHLAITQADVCISTQDNKYMEVEMSSSPEARSFISLLDGYYRLTADAHHYLCHDVAPPRVLLSEANGLHGPMHDDFVRLKLRKEAPGEGACLVRWSLLFYDRIILAVLDNNQLQYEAQNRCTPSHKQFCIQHKASTFSLDGWDQDFSSVKELIDTLKNFILKCGMESYGVKKCCLPRQGELSNLLVKRHNVDHSPDVRSQAPKTLDLCIQIKYKDIIQGCHMGYGTRTKIYSGQLQVGGGGEEELEDEGSGDGRQVVRVVLKVLEQSHEEIRFAFFETASFLSQMSHRHLVLMYGLSVNGSENIVVEEFVEFGPLDVFLRREKGKVTPGWKCIAAKQLASALNYLAAQGRVHGNVCARNILVARPGLEQGASPLVKLSDPGIALHLLSREERLERIPWMAPECVGGDVPVGPGADQWGFGVTLMEIFNDGDLPLSGDTRREEEFYLQPGWSLPSSPQLAGFISKCLSRQPSDRPSFCSLLRDLMDIINTNPDISPSGPPSKAQDTFFQKRFLKFKRELGKGNFGKVSLYMYDPANDGQGELLAVKALKQENAHLSKGWLKEIDILKSLDHQNIVKYRGRTEIGGRALHLIMEYLTLGSLDKFLQKGEHSTSQCVLFAKQICQGMEYLHSQRYIHRDLAARNILVESNTLVKIGDFGLSKYISEDDTYYRVREGGDSPVFWYALECLRESRFSFASDVWSFGVTLYEILTRCDPNQSPPVTFRKMSGLAPEQMTEMVLIGVLERRRRLPCPKLCLPELQTLMAQCWHEEAAQRPSFKFLFEKLENVRLQSNVCFSLDAISAADPLV
ncbi:non-receptor tyrosine-protein kinase TYK2 isoform X2 [Nerophis ophidion]|uniref:non-receptor tyrosine-protein kinase TYK2 isoform X2 n=1 Tax=Nerophis ophidion TaxID=159077 RepID=UPI002AE04ECB|nr:non-receptor tyrosine-protein kinase TYK2 isoform X2 [Nerophis ophidion]